MMWQADVFFRDEEECVRGEGNESFTGSSLAAIFRQLRPYEGQTRLIEIQLIGE